VTRYTSNRRAAYGVLQQPNQSMCVLQGWLTNNKTYSDPLFIPMPSEKYKVAFICALAMLVYSRLCPNNLLLIFESKGSHNCSFY